jgi:cob(I)alamin adenosyltransferase
LNSWVGLLRDVSTSAAEKEALVTIQNNLFTIGSYLATPEEKLNTAKLPALHTETITFLEQQMDQMDESLPEIRAFVLPGGHVNVSYTHVARTVCRRAERLVVGIQSELEQVQFAQRYLNRLSDYLFVLSRYWTQQFKAEEIPWKPAF